MASLIGYDTARVNYHMLTEIPIRLRDTRPPYEASGVNLTKRESSERQAPRLKGFVEMERDLDATETPRAAEGRFDRAKTALAL